MNLGFIGRKKREKQRQDLLKEIKRGMVSYWETNDMSRIPMGITNVDFKKEKDILNITVTLERPGLLIGKTGRNIDGLRKALKKCLKQKVEVLLIEDKSWRNLWI